MSSDLVAPATPYFWLLSAAMRRMQDRPKNQCTSCLLILQAGLGREAGDGSKFEGVGGHGKPCTNLNSLEVAPWGQQHVSAMTLLIAKWAHFPKRPSA
eukprot:1144123-Pelagomonas_calceolata.AAC.3